MRCTHCRITLKPAVFNILLRFTRFDAKAVISDSG